MKKRLSLKMVIRLSITVTLTLTLILLFALILSIWHRGHTDTHQTDMPSETRFLEVEGERIAYYPWKGGEHTVVFLAGWGTPSPYVDFINMMESLPKQASGIIIERFGYGNSDDTKRERSIENIVRELEMVLADSELEPPYIFVAHSLASMEVFDYAIKNQDKVRGIVLIDAGNPEVYATVKPMIAIPRIQRFMSTIGINRFLLEVNAEFQTLIREQNNYALSGWDTEERTQNINRIKTKVSDNYPTLAMMNELKLSQKNAERVIGSRLTFDFPIICLTADMFGNQTDEWIQSQKDLQSWSKKFSWELIAESGHYVHHYQPVRILSAIQTLIESSND